MPHNLYPDSYDWKTVEYRQYVAAQLTLDGEIISGTVSDDTVSKVEETRRAAVDAAARYRK